MGWLGLAIAALWPVVVWAASNVHIIRHRLSGPISIPLNLVGPTIGWAIACAAGIAGDVAWVWFGLGLPVFPVLAQAVSAGLAARGSERIQSRWTRAEFVRFQVGSMLILTAPSGLILALLGYAYSQRHDPGGAAVMLLLSSIGFLFLWSLMWTAVREMRVPGRVVSFPTGAWRTEVERLARRMDAPLRRVFLAQTRAGRIAGAYCLGRSGVGIADALLAALSMEEFKAVMAHEIYHLRQVRETTLCLLLSSTTILCAGLLTDVLGGGRTEGHFMTFAVLVLAVAFFLRGLIGMKRRHEDEADEAAVAFVGALPLIGALAVATVLNGGRFDRGSVRYRSLDARIRRLASLGGCAQEVVEARIARAKEELSAEALVVPAVLNFC